MQLGVKCDQKGYMSHAACRACSLSEHPCEYPVEFLEMMRRENDVQVDRTEFTPSSLLECDRRTVLYTSRDHYIDVNHQWNLLRGSMVHSLVEQRGKYPTGSYTALIREERFTTQVETAYGPQTFSGKPDLVVIGSVLDGVAHVKIVDYKTSTIDHGLTSAKRQHQMQLNMYAYLVERELPAWLTNEFYGMGGPDDPLAYVERVEIDELEIVYVDMKKVRRFTSKGPLFTRGRLINRAGQEYETLYLEPIHQLPIDETHAWIVQRIEEKMKAKEVMPPPLEGDAAWVCPYCPMREACISLASQ